MPTVISHGLFAIILGQLFKSQGLPRRFWLLAVICAILPDLDVAGFQFGIEYADFWGHRGFSHSLLFALLTSLLVVGLGFRQPSLRPLRWRLVLFYFLVTASHGLFDAMTNGGLGIAFFAPFDNSRYFLPWQPIQVSPIGLANFFEWGGVKVLASEAIWIALPSLVLLFFIIVLRYALLRPKPVKINDE